jgi:hypothetical protein
MKAKLLAIAVFLTSFAYYILLACKEYTWVFGGGDAGDWLAQAKIWFLPQPYGSPLYILAAKLVGLMHGNLALNMTILLSCLPAAIAVTAIYLAVLKLKGNPYALVSALVMLGAGVFLSQATIVEEYALASMFVSLAILAWAYNKLWGIILCMALASAVHIIAVLITLVWFGMDLKHWREWAKLSWIYIIVGVVPYLLTLWLMGHAQYYWLENGFSFSALSDYLGSSGTIGSLSIFDLPLRAVQFVGLILGTYALALIPIVKSARKYIVFSVIIGIVLWIYLCDSDPTTWTFTLYAVPFASVLAGIGLSMMGFKALQAVALSACCLMFLNVFYLNADLINQTNPVGRNFYDATMSLPDNSVVVTSQGGFYTLGLLQAIADGKPLLLDFISEKGSDKDTGYQGWLRWANTQGLNGEASVSISRNALAQGLPVYRVNCYLPEQHDDLYSMVKVNDYYNKVVSVGFGSQGR